MALIDPMQIAALPAIFGAAGRLSKVRIRIGEATTTSAGAWSVDLTSAGFTSAPKLLVSALSADTTIANSAVATTTARSLVAVSGFENLPNTIALGGLPERRAAAGLAVIVLVIGP